MLSIEDEIKTRKASQNAVNQRGIQQLCEIPLNETRKRRGFGCGDHGTMCKKTTKQMMKSINVKASKCQFKTVARIKAENYPKNVYSMYCVH